MLEFVLNLLATPVYGNCPVCVVTVGGGLFIAKKLGIDDLLVSIWLSGLNTAIAFWLATKIKKRILGNPFLLSVIFYGITMIYLIASKQIGHYGNTYLGIDKVILGMSVGLVVFLFSVFTDRFIRRQNNKKVLFSYQKVIIPLVFLTIITLIFNFLIK